MDWIPAVVVACGLAIAAITDIRSFKVYNWLTIPLLIGGLAYHGLVSGASGFFTSGFYAVLSVMILLAPYSLGAVGAGDVKLVAGISAWFGAASAFSIVAIAFFGTGVLSLFKLSRQHRVGDAWLNFKVAVMRLRMIACHLGSDVGHETVHDIASRPEARERLLPFSLMLALSALSAFVWVKVFS
jgi:Flp pilus assembly protein protease CpaA